jgi:hypothetical protein
LVICCWVVHAQNPPGFENNGPIHTIAEWLSSIVAVAPVYEIHEALGSAVRLLRADETRFESTKITNPEVNVLCDRPRFDPNFSRRATSHLPVRRLRPICALDRVALVNRAGRTLWLILLQAQRVPQECNYQVCNLLVIPLDHHDVPVPKDAKLGKIQQGAIAADLVAEVPLAHETGGS